MHPLQFGRGRSRFAWLKIFPDSRESTTQPQTSAESVVAGRAGRAAGQRTLRLKIRVVVYDDDFCWNPPRGGVTVARPRVPS
jgi:hypothetical protein